MRYKTRWHIVTALQTEMTLMKPYLLPTKRSTDGADDKYGDDKYGDRIPGCRR